MSKRKKDDDSEDDQNENDDFVDDEDSTPKEKEKLNLKGNPNSHHKKDEDRKKWPSYKNKNHIKKQDKLDLKKVVKVYILFK
jgi:hypothetical protein